MGLQETMKALSDPTRREILKLLREKTSNAGEIAERFDMTSATISHHLSILKEAKLVIQDKRGKFIYYEINTSILDDVLEFFQELKGTSDKDETIIG